MAEARAISSKGWSITVLGLACCAAEADVLPGEAASGADAGVTLATDAGVRSDAGSYNDAEQDFLGGLRRDAGGPTWTSCVDVKTIFERARAGDACDFGQETACSEQHSECAQRTAACVDGALHLGSSSKSACEPDDPRNARRCAVVRPDGCCIDMWQCTGAEDDPAGAPVVQVCAPDCDPTVEVPASEWTLTGWTIAGCPNDPDTPAWPRIWPPPVRMPCEGSFVCDAIGNPAGPDTAFQFGDAGLIYWCHDGVMLSAAIGNHWPWSEVPTL